jgi:N utilization substance protein B
MPRASQARAQPAGSTRRRARELLLRALYQAEVCGDRLAEVWPGVEGEERLPSETRAYAAEVCAVLIERLPEVDAAVRRHLEHWALERLGAIDRGVLRVATAELLAMRATPARVILDQAVLVARRFGGDDSGPFVNGILDRVARELRPGELEEGPRAKGRSA